MSSIALKSGFRQIKDEYNHGLVFSGGDLGVNHRTAFASATERWSYEPQLMVGVISTYRMEATLIRSSAFSSATVISCAVNSSTMPSA